ncbi:PadR family transcriptional regulator [Acidocella sp.]|uniref:PadR family transcriptional regulator n=1 Tax=Acidocella sp. TaxID=50710 RepID=UPI0026178494|nr:PadR family transcriptional regulator [Acidocella sp.]
MRFLPQRSTTPLGGDGLRHGRRFMRGPFEPGGGCGQGGGFGRGRGLRRLLEHGDLRLLVLHLLGQKPSHGYELIKAIEDLTGGAYAPSPGVIYPTLTMLEELGQAEATAAGAKKLYTITLSGRAALAEAQDAVEAMRARLHSAPPREAMAPIIRAMENLKTALRLKAPASPETIKAIATLLDETARKIEEL